MKTNKVLINPDVVVSVLRDDIEHEWTTCLYITPDYDKEPCLNRLVSELDTRGPHPHNKNILNATSYNKKLTLWVNTSDFIDITEMDNLEIEDLKFKIIEQYMIFKGVKNDKVIT